MDVGGSMMSVWYEILTGGFVMPGLVPAMT